MYEHVKMVSQNQQHKIFEAINWNGWYIVDVDEKSYGERLNQGVVKWCVPEGSKSICPFVIDSKWILYENWIYQKVNKREPSYLNDITGALILWNIFNPADKQSILKYSNLQTKTF